MSRAELVVGKYYRISNKIPLLQKPEVLINEAEFKENLIVALGSGSVVYVIEKKGGILNRFFKVNFIRDGKVKLKGWVHAETIKYAKEITKETAFYIQPIKKYNPNKEEIDNAIVNYDNVIGAWLDTDFYGFGIYVLRMNDNNYKIEILPGGGGKIEKKAILSSLSNGSIKIDYENNSGEYDIINLNEDLSFYDKDGFIKSLKKIQYEKIEIQSKNKINVLSQRNNIKYGNMYIPDNSSEFLLIIKMAREDANNDISKEGLTDAFTSGTITSFLLLPFIGGPALIGYNYIFKIKDPPEVPDKRIQQLNNNNKSQTFIDNYSFIYKEEALKVLNRNRLTGNTSGCILVFFYFTSLLST